MENEIDNEDIAQLEVSVRCLVILSDLKCKTIGDVRKISARDFLMSKSGTRREYLHLLEVLDRYK